MFHNEFPKPCSQGSARTGDPFICPKLVTGHLVWVHTGTVRGSQAHGHTGRSPTRVLPRSGHRATGKRPLSPGEGGRGLGCRLQRSWDRESDDRKVFSGREGRLSHAASSEDTQKTSLAKGEGGKLVIKTDRAPERSLGRQARSIGLRPGHRGP